ncbi:acylneuraminate cytidylyltransferase [Shewanella halifaxensis HAW-EB4]|uniref:Acylneuraminate cytidylyltransferase n=1 Tax=Shewanella halifaxensis (strain HAW-EB4) TaxID=458817 RepID=B0TLL3_SHEHH|nr:acylneuraminate cytidylyltransferase [Shewanella halifaxensis]ABZ75963.1 acylneuraminate cytidylyltransferase [Shewanella halifaxensis HAW-EB4]
MTVQHVMFRCDASIQVGMGHIVRCICLANAFIEAGHRVTFVINNDVIAIQALAGLNLDMQLFKQADYLEWCQQVIEQQRPDIFIGDIRDGLPIQAVEMMKQANILTVAIDEPSDYRLACDLLFYPPSPLVEALNWQGFNGKRYAGWEYLLVREEFYTPFVKSCNQPQKVLVMMGGTDPQRLTLTVIEHFRRLDSQLALHVVIKERHPDFAQLSRQQGQSVNLTLHSNPANIAKLMRQMDFAVITFGMSAYELAVLKVPAFHICTQPDHHIASQSFVDKQIAKSIGVTELDKICLFDSKGCSISSGIDNIMSKILAARFVQVNDYPS